jgi:hypothetical protein
VWRRACALPSSYEFFQQRPSLLEVRGVKALGEPAVDRRQQFVGFRTPVLLLPQARQAHSGAQLQGLGLLAAGNLQGALEAGFRLLWLWHRLPQEQDAPQVTDLRFPPAFLSERACCSRYTRWKPSRLAGLAARGLAGAGATGGWHPVVQGGRAPSMEKAV